MSLAMHKGVLYSFRDFLYGRDLNIAAAVERVASHTSPGDTVIFVTGPVWRDLVGSGWGERFQRVDSQIERHTDIEIYRLGTKCRLAPLLRRADKIQQPAPPKIQALTT
jgi:hypothetical protein